MQEVELLTQHPPDNKQRFDQQDHAAQSEAADAVDSPQAAAVHGYRD